METKHATIITITGRVLLDNKVSGDLVSLGDNIFASYDESLHVYYIQGNETYSYLVDVAGYTQLDKLRNSKDVAEVIGPLAKWFDRNPLDDDKHIAIIEPYLVKFVDTPQNDTVKQLLSKASTLDSGYYLVLDTLITPNPDYLRLNLLKLQTFRWKQDAANVKPRQKTQAHAQ